MELSNTIKHSEDSVDVKYYRKVPEAALIPQQGTCFSYLFAIIRHVDTGRCLGAKNHLLICWFLCFSSPDQTLQNDLRSDNKNSVGFDLIIHGSDFYKCTQN